jgi:two-component system sensor histidine kinase KdpD
MQADRPNPDELLRDVTRAEKEATRGKLTIFFGAAPGVGKTYAMLEAARLLLYDDKKDVVIGIVETHGRYDTGALLLGLPILPRRVVPHRGIKLEELDVDGALARRPEVLLVDELAHTNAPGSRHAKRWQAVAELLDAGIDVMTTLNVQHIASLNDVVAEITSVVVKETVPDSVIEEASEMHLVDLPPEQLLERLREGRVYLPAQAERAAQSFFRKGNLIALRELALRQTAERVDRDMRVYRATHGIERTWRTTERLLVAVSPSPASSRLLRAGRRMAGSLHATWIAAYVETPRMRLAAKGREQIARNLRLAQELGAETVTLTGEDAAGEMLRYAQKRNVSKIVVGKPTHARWRDLVRRSFLDTLVRASGDADVYVISGDERVQPAPLPPEARLPKPGATTAYVAGGLVVAVATLVSWELFGQDQLADAVMIFLLGIVIVAMRFGYGPSLFAAVLAVGSFDYFFVPPYFTFAVSDLRHIGTFGIMFTVAIIISGLTQRIQAQANAAREGENRTASLYAMSRELAAAAGVVALHDVAVRHLADVFGGAVVILTPNREGHLEVLGGGDLTFVPDEKDLGVAEWAYVHDRSAGLSTDTLPSASALYVPLRAGASQVGVLGIRPRDPGRFLDPGEGQLLATFTGQVAGALERATLAEETEKARVLSSVSHDLRTPLAVITGSAATLQEGGLDDTTRSELTAAILEEGQRLNRLVRNLLDMTRLQAGALVVKKEWQAIEEVIGSALGRLEDRLGSRPIQTVVPTDLPMAPFDPVLIEQVLVNLLENAIKYTPEGSALEITAEPLDSALKVTVSDHGPGVPEADVEKVFEKFYRVGAGKGGVGLGLTICRGIVTAHGGKLWVENRPLGGAAFSFTVPIEGEPPLAPPPDEEQSEDAHD